uniref:long-chain-fatty-acid--CoA ligase n=1 Tax=Sinocyclocheilus grahami TaxID=75366 RepID=A0A672K454_SINGR
LSRSSFAVVFQVPVSASVARATDSALALRNLGVTLALHSVSSRGSSFIGVVCIYTTNSPDACLYVANVSRANIIVVENQKHLIPHLKAIVQYSGSLKEKLPNLYSWEEFMGLGPEVSDQEQDKAICSQKANQCCGSLVDTLREVTPTAHMGFPRRHFTVWIHEKETSDKSFLFTLADSLVLQKLCAELGFSNCMKLFSGAAPIGSETLQFFLGLNIRLYEAYRMSESSDKLMSGPKVYRFSSCGKVVPGCQYKLVNVDGDGIGEVCFWGHENGFLYITGRIKELIITAGGENIPPLPIEDAVKQELPIISNAMLIGDKRTFLSMHFEFRVNSKATSNAHRIQKWTILGKDFSIVGGELGPTMKLRRPVVLQMYDSEIQSFYRE